uniref:Uncharacterized protein n=1 Tax=Podoviridae sp. ct8Lf7 TaxID=2827723 RepID=A0A8S5S035_9CAUD|nr:MAG TPA: hypothetical protein [Podoviridae sp. ct8Lf7]
MFIYIKRISLFILFLFIFYYWFDTFCSSIYSLNYHSRITRCYLIEFLFNTPTC